MHRLASCECRLAGITEGAADAPIFPEEMPLLLLRCCAVGQGVVLRSSESLPGAGWSHAVLTGTSELG